VGNLCLGFLGDPSTSQCSESLIHSPSILPSLGFSLSKKGKSSFKHNGIERVSVMDGKPHNSRRGTKNFQIKTIK